MSLRSRLKDYQIVDGIPYLLHATGRFAVSACGLVLGKTLRTLKPKTQGKYLIVSYQADCKKIRHMYVHRLVAEAWIDNAYGRPYVNHKDGNRNNNTTGNLEWVTAKENTAHAIATGLVTNIPTKGQLGFQCAA